MKLLGEFLLPLDGMLVHRRSLPHSLLRFPNNSPVPIYTPGWKEALWELCVLTRTQHSVPGQGSNPDRSLLERAHWPLGHCASEVGTKWSQFQCRNVGIALGNYFRYNLNRNEPLSVSYEPACVLPCNMCPMHTHERLCTPMNNTAQCIGQETDEKHSPLFH